MLPKGDGPSSTRDLKTRRRRVFS